MRSRSATLGVLFATTTAVVWGGQFVVGKSALESVNAFPLSTVRYALAAALWLVVLAVLEGRAPFGWAAGAGGSSGSARSASPDSTCSPTPALRTLGRRPRRSSSRSARFSQLSSSGGGRGRVPRGNVRPARGRAVRGCARRQRRPPQLDRARGDRVGRGARPRGGVQLRALQPRRRRVLRFSPLRYTALTAALGWLTIAGATVVATATGLVEALRPPTRVRRAADPVPRDPRRVRRRPDVERGDRLDRAAERSPLQQSHPGHDLRDRDRPWLPPERGELLGAALTVGALVANNLLARRSAPAAATTSVALPEAA